jgi:hypothetical protein
MAIEDMALEDMAPGEMAPGDIARPHSFVKIVTPDIGIMAMDTIRIFRSLKSNGPVLA